MTFLHGFSSYTSCQKFLVFAAVLLCVFLIASVDNIANAEVGPGGDNPSVDSVYMSSTSRGKSDDFTSGINLVAGNNKTVYINGIVSDPQGASTITSVEVTFYRSGVGSSCSADNNNCYIISCDTYTILSLNELDYDCPVPMTFYTDATDDGSQYSIQNWIARVEVEDRDRNTDVDSSETNDVNSLLALDIPTSMDFGTLLNNQKTTVDNNLEMSIEQQGNDEADVLVSGTDMSCSTLGSIPAGNQKWSLSDLGYDGNGTNALTDGPTDTNLDVGYRTDDGTPLTKTLYWNVFIPYNVVGSCSGTDTVTAIAH